jgi:hypothetical protein
MNTKITLLMIVSIVMASCSIDKDENYPTQDSTNFIIELPGIDDQTTGGDTTLYQDDLWAGQNIDVGTVTVTVSGDGTLTVTYETEGDWQIDETHLFIGDIGDLPLNGGGNPQIGQFPYSSVETGGTTFVSFIHVDTLAVGECVYIAAHAVVTNIVTGESETAWGNGDPIGGGNGGGNGNGNGGGSWAMGFEVCNN